MSEYIKQIINDMSQPKLTKLQIENLTEDEIKIENIKEIKRSINDVYFILEYGLSEVTYQKALKLDLQNKFNIVETEKSVPVIYLNHEITTLKADIIVENQCILELKTITKLTDKERNQLKRYMKTLNISHGLLVNFGKELEIIDLNL